MIGRLSVQRWVVGLIAVGTVVRLVLAVWLPATGDIALFQETAGVVREHGLSAYGALNDFDPARPFNYRLFSYPPGFLPWLLLADVLPTSWFPTVERLVPIAGDAALAALVAAELRARRAAPRVVVAGVALIALSPVFIAVSAVNGQVDGVAFVFLLLALRVWRTAPPTRRAIAAGLLIGVGATIKTVPLVFVLAFLPVVADRREALRLLAAAAAVPVAGLLPFLAADAHGVISSIGYAGFPGGGGLTLLVQPDLASHYLSDYDLRTWGLARWLQDHGVVITVAAIAAAGGWLYRRRLPPLDGALVLATVTLLFAMNFYEQYMLWLLPLALAAGRLVLAVALELIMVPYLLVTGALPHLGALVGWLELSGRAAVQVACVASLSLALLAALWNGRRAQYLHRQ